MKQRSAKSELEEAQKDFLAARKKVLAAEDRVKKEEIEPRLQTLVGSCYKYRNSYSCPEKESDYWWLYRRIVGVGDGKLLADEFQIDEYGNLFAKRRETVYPTSDFGIPDEYILISEGEYDAARATFLAAASEVSA